jgi:hypothetical protein
MTSGRTIKITIDPMGNPKVEAVGFNGIGCGDATKAIEQALAGPGGEVTREMKPEWHQMEDESQQETEGVRW